MNKKFFAALASATMAFSATGSLAVFAQDFVDEDNPVVPSTPKPTVDKIAWNEDNFGILANVELTKFTYTNGGTTATLTLNADKKTVNTADLEKITSISVEGTAATPINGEVKGLEYFTGLTTFTSAATTTSHATLTNDTLDFSANTALKTLDVENAAELSNIVLPNPEVNDDEEEVYSLTSLTLTGTALTSLDLSAQEALYDSTTTNPTTINVSGNKNLKELQLAKGTAKNLMNVDTLNLSNNSLEDVNLRNYNIATSLNLGGNHLGTLDLSKTTIPAATTQFAQTFYIAEDAGSVNLTELFPSIVLDNVTETGGGKLDKKTGVYTFGTANTYNYTAKDSGGTNTATLNVTFTPSNPMFRLYNPNSGEHFYTANADEQEALVKLGWSDEGYGWVAPTKAEVEAAPTTHPAVYRLYNPNAGDHHYTTDENEKNILVSVGWKDEEIGWYSAPASGNVPVYREYNPNAKAAGAHNYTTNKVENDFLLSVGWLNEGIAWYALQ